MTHQTLRGRRGATRTRTTISAVLLAVGACSTDNGLARDHHLQVIGGGQGGDADQNVVTGAGQAGRNARGGGSPGSGGISSNTGGVTMVSPGAPLTTGGFVPENDIPSGFVTDRCGNGIIEGYEVCDDGNTAPEDGCTSSCSREWAFQDCSVPGEPCFTIRCGDGVRSFTEVCDDGNVVNGDGCMDNCQEVGEGWRCVVPGAACTPICGDARTLPPETCDDGNTENGDGCSSRCLLEPGAYCINDSCSFSVCGNGVLEAGEACDEGEANGMLHGEGQGCSIGCTPEPVCEELAGGELQCTTVCGNGSTEEGEDCDDGNRFPGDGCSEECSVELGYTCASVEIDGRLQSECLSQCGDGILAGGEECDKGERNGDGTYGGCRTDCTLGAHCGDGIRDVAVEQCDDGPANLYGYYVYDYLSDPEGCTPSCTAPFYCGDGLVSVHEQCDDGHPYDNDGCSNACTVRRM